MHPELENELLLHVAAGTDPLTALAALPSEGDSSVKSPTEPSTASSGAGWIAFAVLVAIAALLLLR
jgi:hypothetical protein